MKYTRFALFGALAAIFHEADTGDNVGNTQTLLSTDPAKTGDQSQQQPVPSLVTDDGAFADGWTAKLPDELGDYRAGLGKFKTLGDFAKSYQGLEQRLGKAAHATFVPGENATPEEVTAFRKAMGVPDSADGYKLKPDTIPEGVEWNDEAVKPFLAIAHKHNISEAAMRDFVALDLQREQSRFGGVEAAAKAQLELGNKDLADTWGEKLGSNLATAKSVANTLGLDLESPGLTDPNVVKALFRVSQLVSEDKFHDVGASHGMTPAQRAKDIQTNPQNPLYKAYQEGDPDVTQQVLALLAK